MDAENTRSPGAPAKQSLAGSGVDESFRKEREAEQVRRQRENALNAAFALAAQTGEINSEAVIRSAKEFLHFNETGHGVHDPQPCAGPAPYEDESYKRQRALDYATQSLGRNGGSISDLLDRARQILAFINEAPAT